MEEAGVVTHMVRSLLFVVEMGQTIDSIPQLFLDEVTERCQKDFVECAEPLVCCLYDRLDGWGNSMLVQSTCSPVNRIHHFYNMLLVHVLFPPIPCFALRQ